MENVGIEIKETLLGMGIDIEAIKNSPLTWIIIALYIAALVYYIVRNIQGRYISPDATFIDLGIATFCIPWGAMLFPLMLQTINDGLGLIQILLLIVMVVILLFIWAKPISIITELIKDNGALNGIIYSVVLLGFGTVAIIAAIISLALIAIPVFFHLVVLYLDYNSD